MKNKLHQPPFSGESRMLLVDGLVDILDKVNKTNKACWVSLEAPSGWGKTRVVQELYARLAARQTMRYWPANILETHDVNDRDVAARRKKVFPDPAFFNRQAKALPEFMWLGIACDCRNGIASQTLLEDLQQLEAHSDYLEAAHSVLASFSEGLFPSKDKVKNIVLNILDEGAGLGLEKVVEKLAEVTSVPGMGLAVNLTKWGVGKVSTSRKNKSIVAESGPLAHKSTREDLLDDTVRLLTRLARPGLPTVVFIEDLHSSTPLIEKLIEKLVRSDSAILIITSTWPDELMKREQIPKLLEDKYLKERILRVQHDQAPPNAFPPGASMEELPKDALRTIILSYHQNATPKTVEQLAARYNNPWPLELVCTLPAYQNDDSGELNLTQQEIEELPDDAVDFYRMLWRALPLAAQQALVLATLAIPDNESTWNNRLTQTVVAHCKTLANHEEIADVIDKNNIPHGWERIVEKHLRRYNEPDQLDIARQYVKKYFSESDIDSYLDQLARSIVEDTPVTNAEEQHRAWMMLSLHRRGKISDQPALGAIRTLQLYLENFPRELASRIELGSYALTLDLTSDIPAMLDARFDYAIALSQSGKYKEAMSQLIALLPDQQRKLGEYHRDVFRTRDSIASCHGELGDTLKAVELCKVLVKDKRRELGNNYSEIQNTVNNLACWYGESGRNLEAIVLLKDLLDDQLRVLRDDHPHVLHTRSNIAYYLARSNQNSEALALLKDLLDDQMRVCGSTDISTLRTQHHIALCHAGLGHTRKAIELGKTLLTDQQRELGNDHPEVLETRNSIAYWLATSSQKPEALRQLTTLLNDQGRILGEVHPSNLRTRYIILMYSNQNPETLTQLKYLLDDSLKMWKPNDPNILEMRRSIALCHAGLGHTRKAIELAKTLLTDQQRELGNDHPEALETRNSIAYWLAKL